MALGLLLLAIRAAAGAASAGDAMPVGKGDKPAKLFASEATLAITLTAPWREFARKKESPAVYPATLEYADEAGSRRSIAITVEPRGITRLRVCGFPPIKLGFDRAASRNTMFRGNKSLKLVTHCASGQRWEQYPVREWLAYRIYNQITERSFRVRPLSVTYVDSARHSTDGPHFAFLIEDDSELAKRNKLEKLELPVAKLSQFDPLENNRFALFQFLIGNTDWAVLRGPYTDRCCHNSRLLGSKAHASVVAVPYDFDSSGLVDAHYAAPNEALPIQSNRTRLYRGFCAYQASLQVAREELLQREGRILGLVREQGALSEDSREYAQAYLSKGFDILRNDDTFAGWVTAKCRK